MADADHAALLRLNAGNYPAVWPLAKEDLASLPEGCHLVAVDPAGDVLGYLLSFSRASRYGDAEMQWFRRHIAEPFFFVSQVVIAQERRGHGIGRALYDALALHAQQTGARILCCDVNIDPPNPESLAFHHKLGFAQIGSGRASNGFAIALLVRKW